MHTMLEYNTLTSHETPQRKARIHRVLQTAPFLLHTATSRTHLCTHHNAFAQISTQNDSNEGK
eukprot:m.936659 g.936659  ORF g.936659 m.936659 type:complete len:63 (-) comp23810_c3_seq3:285-473(-)